MIKEKKERFIAEEVGRLDKVASAFIKRTIFSKDSTKIFLNGREVKKSTKVKNGDVIEIEYEEDVFTGLEKEDISLNVIYEDDDILVIDKKEGMVVHPGSGVNSGTIANALLFRYGDDFLSSDDDVRPGIAHRLDKDTSGVMVIAKNEDALRILSSEFKERETVKYYIAIAKGVFKEKEGIIEKNIIRDRAERKRFKTTNDKEGRYAKTGYKVLYETPDYSLLLLRLYTGRTHQIRVHLKSINHPIIGDPIYSSDKTNPLMLHSLSLTINHPKTNERMTFKTEIPERFKPYLAGYHDVCLK